MFTHETFQLCAAISRPKLLLKCHNNFTIYLSRYYSTLALSAVQRINMVRLREYSSLQRVPFDHRNLQTLELPTVHTAMPNLSKVVEIIFAIHPTIRWSFVVTVCLVLDIRYFRTVTEIERSFEHLNKNSYKILTRHFRRKY